MKCENDMLASCALILFYRLLLIFSPHFIVHPQTMNSIDEWTTSDRQKGKHEERREKRAILLFLLSSVLFLFFWSVLLKIFQPSVLIVSPIFFFFLSFSLIRVMLCNVSLMYLYNLFCLFLLSSFLSHLFLDLLVFRYGIQGLAGSFVKGIKGERQLNTMLCCCLPLLVVLLVVVMLVSLPAIRLTDCYRPC